MVFACSKYEFGINGRMSVNKPRARVLDDKTQYSMHFGYYYLVRLGGELSYLFPRRGYGTSGLAHVACVTVVLERVRPLRAYRTQCAGQPHLRTHGNSNREGLHKVQPHTLSRGPL